MCIYRCMTFGKNLQLLAKKSIKSSHLVGQEAVLDVLRGKLDTGGQSFICVLQLVVLLHSFRKQTAPILFPKNNFAAKRTHTHMEPSKVHNLFQHYSHKLLGNLGAGYQHTALFLFKVIICRIALPLPTLCRLPTSSPSAPQSFNPVPPKTL